MIPLTGFDDQLEAVRPGNTSRRMRAADRERKSLLNQRRSVGLDAEVLEYQSMGSLEKGGVVPW